MKYSSVLNFTAPALLTLLIISRNWAWNWSFLHRERSTSRLSTTMWQRFSQDEAPNHSHTLHVMRLCQDHAMLVDLHQWYQSWDYPKQPPPCAQLTGNKSDCLMIETRLCALRTRNAIIPFLLEPEGRNTEEVYVRRLSTSSPGGCPCELVHSIKGLEMQRCINRLCHWVWYGLPHRATLKLRKSQDFSLPVVTNGTSGYEECWPRDYRVSMRSETRQAWIDLKRSDVIISSWLSTCD